jgi:serine/threonine-protein kinase
VAPRHVTHRTNPDHATWEIDAGRIGAYRVISAISHGGTSSVYLGEHRVTGERVAIKMLDAFYAGYGELVHRLLGERELASRVRHAGLIDIRGAGQTPDGVPYVMMAYLDGESLGAQLTRAALPIDAVTAIGAQIASAVAALHAAGIVHCDLKPQNVLVLREQGPGGGPRIKVIDYSVARRVDEPPLDEGVIAGTPAFMAPEQWRGAPNEKSDVYALGCTMYELVTGQPVFSGTLPQLMRAHCERLPERPSTHRPEIPAELERIIVRSLAKDPAMRPTMAELEVELRRLVVVDVPAALDATG